jgi:dihydroorotate dehydrogenase (NAD+) catalytic subunit
MPKTDLAFSRPLMNAAGSLGFAPDLRAEVAWKELGAFITNPISLRPRAATGIPALLEYPGGFLLHTGLPNPGFARLLRRHAQRWERSPLPIIVNLMADRPEETRDMVRALEGRDNIIAVELGFAPLLADDLILLAVERSIGELPVIVCLPSEQLLRLGPRALNTGAAAVSLAAPRGALVREASVASGRLFGPALYPQALEMVRAAALLGLPIIGAGGVFSAQDADEMLAAGALGVQLDAQLWLPRPIEKSPVN